MVDPWKMAATEGGKEGVTVEEEGEEEEEEEASLLALSHRYFKPLQILGGKAREVGCKAATSSTSLSQPLEDPPPSLSIPSFFPLSCSPQCAAS